MRTLPPGERHRSRVQGLAARLAAVPVALILAAVPAPAQRVSGAVPVSLVQLAPPESLVVVRSADPLPVLLRFLAARGLGRDPSLGGLLDREQAQGLQRLQAALRVTGDSREARVIREVLAGEVVAGVLVRNGSPAAFVLARGRDADAILETAERLASLVRAPRCRARAGVVAFGFPGGDQRTRGSLAVADELVVLGSQPGLAEEIVDRYARAAWAPRSQHDLGRAGFVQARLDLAALRSLAGEAVSRSAREPGSLLFVAPWVEALLRGSEANARLDLDAGAVTLEVSVPRALANLTAGKRELLLSGDFDPDLVPAFAGEIARLSLSTSLRAYFEHRVELLDRNALAGAEQGISLLTLFFGGRKFDDVLKHMSAGLHFVVAREPWEEREPAPRIRFPAAAMVLSVADPSLEKALHSALQTAALVGNGDRARKGLPLFRVDKDIFMDVDLSSARLRDGSWQGDPPTEAGLSPSVALVAGRAVLATSESLTRSLVGALLAGEERARRRDEDRRVLARIAVSAAGVIGLLRDGRPALRVNAVLESGKSISQVDREFEALLQIVANVRSLRGSLTASDAGDLGLHLTLELAPPLARAPGR